jgi:hypothetical protein
VGGKNSVPLDNNSPRIKFAFEGSDDFDGLNTPAKPLRKGTANEFLQTTFNVVE